MLRCNTIYGIGLSGRGTLRAHFLRAQLFFITRLSTSYFLVVCSMYECAHVLSTQKFPTCQHRTQKEVIGVVKYYL